MEAKNVIDQEEKLNATNLEGIHYEYKYNPEFKRYDIEFELDDNCDQRILNFIENLYQKSKGLNFQLDSIQDNKQKQIIELLLSNKPASNTNRPISAEIKIHEAKFSIKITSKKNTLTEAQKIELIRFWKVPILPNHFIGRQQLLEKLEQRLNPKKGEASAVVLIACHGLGGIGKTFLAAQYAQTQRENYTFTLWFNAENDETLYRDYYDFATAIQLPVENQSPENVIVIVKNWLQQRSNWLIVYDNAPDDKLIANYRPANGGKVLITSRNNAWGKNKSLAIDVFSREEAKDYIVELTGFALDDHQAAIDKLAGTLGYLPLALAQACAYIAVNNLSLEDYLKLYDEMRVEMLADETMPPENTYKFTVAITWNITFEAIKKQQSAANILLESCAFLNGSQIPEFLLKELFAKQAPELAKQMKPFIDVIRCLQQYSMLKLINQDNQKLFNVHNLIQEIIITSISNDNKEKYLFEVLEIFKNTYSYGLKDDESIELFNKQRQLEPHLQSFMSKAIVFKKELSHIKDYDFRILYHPFIFIENIYCKLRNSPIRIKLLKEILKIEEIYYSRKSSEVAKTLNSLGSAYCDLEDNEKQYECIIEAKNILEKLSIYGEEYAATLNNLAIYFGKKGEIQKKIDLLKQVLKIEDKSHKKYKINLAATYYNIANSYQDLSQYEEAKLYFERSLEIRLELHGQKHHLVAETKADLANTIGDLGDLIKKKEILKEVLPIIEFHYGENHPIIAKILSNLGETYRRLKKFEKAIFLQDKALEIEVKCFGQNNIHVAKTLRNLALVYGDLAISNHQSKYFNEYLDKKKKLLECTLKIQNDYYHRPNPEIAVTKLNLAINYFNQKQLDLGMKFYQEAYEIFSNHPEAGQRHPHTKIARDVINSIAQAYDSNKRSVLHWAVIQQALSCIKLLLKAGADMLKVDSVGKSSINYASESIVPDALFLLLSHHYKSSLDDIDLGKLLRRATHQNNTKHVKLLLKHIENIDEKDNGITQRTALHWAVIQNATDCIEALIIAGADPTIADASGNTPLDYAKGKVQILELLQKIKRLQTCK